MYSPLDSAKNRIPSPEGAMPWAEISKRFMSWTPELLGQLQAERDMIKNKFSEAVLH